VLYAVCRRHFTHSEIGGVRAKLYLVGRTYATGIERLIRSNDKQGGAMGLLARYLVDNARKLNPLFSELRGIREPLTEAKLKRILKLHACFVEILRKLPQLREKQFPRAFASKYMHFHCPAVPIMDAFADKALRKRVPKKDSQSWIPAKADRAYAEFLVRFWQLYDEAQRSKLSKPLVKHLDRWLLLSVDGSA
jgi:hypothetical protein